MPAKDCDTLLLKVPQDREGTLEMHATGRPVNTHTLILNALVEASCCVTEDNTHTKRKARS